MTDQEFKTMIQEDIREIKSGVKEVSTKLQDFHIQVTEKYVPHEKFESSLRDNADFHRWIVGWVLGVYGLAVTLVITVFLRS